LDGKNPWHEGADKGAIHGSVRHKIDWCLKVVAEITAKICIYLLVEFAVNIDRCNVVVKLPFVATILSA